MTIEIKVGQRWKAKKGGLSIKIIYADEKCVLFETSDGGRDMFNNNNHLANFYNLVHEPEDVQQPKKEAK